MSGTFTDNRLYIFQDTVVISDLHLPDGAPVESRWTSVLEASDNCSTLILNGDFLTGFPPSENALSMLEEAVNQYETVRYHLGNHEEMTVPSNKALSPEDVFGSQVEDYQLEDLDIGMYSLIGEEDVLVTHGHRVSVDMPTDEVEEIVIGHIHPSQPAKTPVALSSPFRFDERVSVTVCPAFGSGISNFSYKDQNRMNDFIESIPQSSVLKSFEADVSE